MISAIILKIQILQIRNQKKLIFPNKIEKQQGKIFKKI